MLVDSSSLQKVAGGPLAPACSVIVSVIDEVAESAACRRSHTPRRLGLQPPKHGILSGEVVRWVFWQKMFLGLRNQEEVPHLMRVLVNDLAPEPSCHDKLMDLTFGVERTERRS